MAMGPPRVAWAASNGHRNGPCKRLRGSQPAEDLSRPSVQLGGRGIALEGFDAEEDRLCSPTLRENQRLLGSASAANDPSGILAEFCN